MRTFITFVAISLVGCLPPPRDWLEQSSSDDSVQESSTSTDEVPSGDEGIPPEEEPSGDDSVEDSGATDGMDEDSGEVSELLCHSVDFDDSGRVVIRPASLGIDGFLDSQSVTIDVWTWFSDSTVSGSWLLAGVEGVRAWRLAIEGGRVVLRAGMYDTSIAVPDEGWHHIAGVIDGDGGQMMLYLDGERVVVREWSGGMESLLVDPSMMVGAWHTDGGAWPNSIAELRFSNTVMHDESDFSPVVDASTDGWLGVWRFNENLKNDVTGLSATGDGVRYTNACP